MTTPLDIRFDLWEIEVTAGILRHLGDPIHPWAASFMRDGGYVKIAAAASAPPFPHSLREFGQFLELREVGFERYRGGERRLIKFLI